MLNSIPNPLALAGKKKRLNLRRYLEEDVWREDAALFKEEGSGRFV